MANLSNEPALAEDDLDTKSPILPEKDDTEPIAVPADALHAPAEFLHLYSALESHALEIEQPASLAFNAMAEGGLRQERPYVLGVTSAVPGEGKTTTAMHLALTMAMNSYKRICLMDFSLEQQAYEDLGTRFGLTGNGGPETGGVVDVLEEASQTLPTFQMADPDNLTVVPRGRPAARAARLARSPRIDQIISSGRHAFDVIILDLPSVSSENALPLSRHVDGLLMVVHAGATPRDLVQRAVDVIGKDRFVGLALNRQKTNVPEWLARLLKL